MEIVDNFLDQKIFDELQTIIMGDRLPWNYFNCIDFDYDGKGDKKKFQFIHVFYMGSVPHSPFMEKLKPILKIIDPISLYRIKANLLTRTSNIVENSFHCDISFATEEKLKQWTTSIFYVNTNNGYTKFEDGSKVESVANRMVIFPSNMKHTGTSCTDEKTRVVINFNYFK